ncbi:unnamed protein product [Linum tenue]|uniref:Uncharacterized protein n=1 Tax=Linum tenue TaxID=586396 RepID=A0AAV0LMH0_9ROSI|nr:unnamed protein product [Linum tenue]
MIPASSKSSASTARSQMLE